MAPAKPKKRRILIVEDDDGVRAVEATTLKLAGYDVVEAATGEEGLERIRKRTFDLVLLDLMMPGMNGYEFLEKLRAMPNRADVPVIIVTARGRDQEGMLQEASRGADDHIDKPFTPSTLESAVEAVLARTPEELATKRALQTRAVGVYEAILNLRANPDDDDAPELRIGLLRRGRR